MRNERLTYVDTDNGAFKEVRIYETYVVKSAKNEDYNYLTYSNARYSSMFRDDEGEFHPSWVDNYNDNRTGRSEDENQEELENEFTFMKTFGHLPIITPILWGDAYEYAMPKVKIFDELDARPRNDRLKKDFHKKVLRQLTIRINRSGLKVSTHFISRNCRTKNIIDTGYYGGLSVERTARDLFYFVYLDLMRDLGGDMHTGNLGIYRGHIVTFDTGRANTENNGARNYIRKKGILNNLSWIYHNETSQTDLHNLALRSKYDKLVLKLTSRYNDKVAYVRAVSVITNPDSVSIKDKDGISYSLDRYIVEVAD